MLHREYISTGENLHFLPEVCKQEVCLTTKRRIADMRITNMNAAMEAVRQSVIKKKGNGNNFIAISSRVRFHSIWIRTLFLPFLITTRILIDKNDYNDYNGD